MKGQENLSELNKFSCFRKNVCIFSGFKNMFIKSRNIFSVSFEAFAVQIRQIHYSVHVPLQLFDTEVQG